MTGRTHDLAAFTALSAVVIFHGIPEISLGTTLVAVTANLIGGIAPDIDEPTAPLWRNLPIGKYVGKVFDKLLGGHRFISHSLIGVALFGFLFYLLLQFLHPIMSSISITIVWWSFMIGLVSHLVMDSFTKEGVPWLLPLPINFGFPPLKALRITTGKIAENLIVFPGLLLINVYLYYTHYRLFLGLFHHLK
jgi:inner membrane protein